MRAALRFASIFLAASLSLAANAWIETGHMVVAEIAERNLSPKARAAVQELAKIGTDAKTNTFVTCSVWADDYKSDTDRAWHYINIHFRKDGKPVTNKAPEENVVWAIIKFKKVLGDPKASKEDRALALRYLVHFVGDVHQPMHGVAEDSGDHPEGDRGGNDFKIAPIEGWSQRPLTNLHVLWDFGCGDFLPTDRPLNPKETAKIDRLAAEIMKEYPRAKIDDLKVQDPMKWALESFALAKSAAYNLNEHKPVSKEYLKKGREICRERAAAAGYRLADLLNEVLD